MARGKRKPAAVSGPGALSRRTDLTPAGQPVRVPTGGPYGQATQLEHLQQSAPLSAGPTPATPAGVTPPAPPESQDAFGPTQRPSESPVAGAGGLRVLPSDPNMLLRVLYQIYPHPDIARLIDIEAG